MYTLKALGIVELIWSKIKPPANVPTIPPTIVVPPNNKSASVYKKRKTEDF